MGESTKDKGFDSVSCRPEKKETEEECHYLLDNHPTRAEGMMSSTMMLGSVNINEGFRLQSLHLQERILPLDEFKIDTYREEKENVLETAVLPGRYSARCRLICAAGCR